MNCNRIPPIDVDQLHRLAALVPDDFAMMGSWLNVLEAECMVAQTLRVASRNAAKGLFAYSVRDANVLQGRQVCGTNNASSYARLLREELLIELVTGDETHVYPTQKLLDAVEVHFRKEVAPCEPQ